MATRSKKAKKKAKKTARKKPATRKKAVKKSRRAAVRPKAKAKKAKPKKKVVRAAVKPRKKAKAKPVAAKPAPKPALAVPANEERIGIVTHYFSHLSVAIIKLETGMLREGDTIHIKGHTSDFRQTVGSMELNHVHVSSTRSGESFGLKVKEHAREHDVVYRLKGA